MSLLQPFYTSSSYPFALPSGYNTTPSLSAKNLVNSWINSLPQHFQRAGLSVVASDAQSPLPEYRKPWNEDNLIGIGSFGEKLSDPEEKAWFLENHARAATEAAKGWYVDWELVVCVGRKDGA